MLPPVGGGPAVSGRELRDLLAPVPPERFIAEYWNRKALRVPGRPGKLRQLLGLDFDRTAFYRIVRETAVRKSKGFRLDAGIQTTRSFREPGTHQFSRIQPEQVEEVFAEGATVLAECLSDPVLVSFATALKAQLNHAGEVIASASLSPPGAGVTTHFDRSNAFFIQCEGKKSYQISERPVLEWPHGTGTVFADGTVDYSDHSTEPWEEVSGIDVTNLTEVILEPGDVLFVPAGAIHATEAVDSFSLNLNIQFGHCSFLRLLTMVLERALLSSPAWRHIPAVDPAGLKAGELPAEVRQFFAARLEELRDRIAALTADAWELNWAWQKLLTDPGEATAASLPLAATDPQGGLVRAGDRLRLSRQLTWTCARGAGGDGEAGLTLFGADKEITVSEEWAPFLSGLLQANCFTAGSAVNWAGEGRRYDWDDVRAYLEALLGQGKLERA